MRFTTAEKMREIDRRAISQFAIPGHVLMDRAGRAVARAVTELARVCRLARPRVCLVAGRGNNGGDAFAAARVLHLEGIHGTVLLAGTVAQVKGEARLHLDRMEEVGVAPLEIPGEGDWMAENDDLARDYDIIVDALLGTGSSGPPRGAVAGAIRFINAKGRHGLVIAVDIPSGMDAGTGSVEGECVRADLTLAMAFPKAGFLAAGAGDFTGSVDVADIGVPPSLAAEVQSVADLIVASELQRLLPRRNRSAHKGDFGRAVLIGGARGFGGAIALAAGAAVRSGAGLVSVVVPLGMVSTVAPVVPEAMVHGVAETAQGSLSLAGLSGVESLVEGADCILMGPGATPHEETRRIVDFLIERGGCPLVLDADGLNTCAGRAEVLGKARAPLVITPHPGEMGRLLGCGAGTVQADRFAAVARARESTGAVVVLKGAGTLVAGPGDGVSINLCGNPGMATGGTGDVLAGLMAGLVAQGLPPGDAARLGVFLHGHAGDRVAWRSSQAGMTAHDIVKELPEAFRDLSPR